ncbi:uncharacterized protein LOC126824422 [Patella vulgata]|uniref:uncharacterized protein LOC126824422 n=1 Tax=Patella vulgata TaxID=6465 RepID=UPI0021804F29|nr:uncharacterized protein LOC126824422 [Patella vulgata]
MAKYSSIDGLQGELSCPICLELFEKPITLPCDHALCEKCLEQVQTDKALGKKLDVIKCPLCRRSADVCTNPLVKNLILERIVRVYKEDRECRLKRTESCNLNEIQRSINTDNGADAPQSAPLARATQCYPRVQRPESMALTLPTQETALFCNPYDPGSTDNKPLRPSGSVLELRSQLNPLGDGDFLTKCTGGCSERSAKAVILCTQCKNQYCRLCWEHHPSLDGEDTRDHKQRLHVYVTAFLDDINAENCIECNNCEPEVHEPATLICLNCNVNFCETCFKVRHPALVINHYVVKKPNVLPKPPQLCTFCTKQPSNMAKLSCKGCKKNFCSNCFMDAIHGCVKDVVEKKEVRETGTTDQVIPTERQIQREMVNLMNLKKQLIQEIPLFFSKQNQLKKPKPDIKVGDRVVSYPEAQNVELRAVVKWIGQLPGDADDNITVGVEFDDAVGGGDGTYNGTRLFESKNGHTGFIPILSVIREVDVAPAIYTNVGVDDTTVNTDIPRVCDIEEDTVSDNLLIGDRVAYFREDSFVKGTVKWIGCLPDDTTGTTSVGVEFDSPIGSGTGKYKDHRLFYAKQNHASLLPILGLIKVEDL